jgi:hypothetical protein
LTNPLFPGYIKIGYAKCLRTRLDKLATGVPMGYKVAFKMESEYAKEIESFCHQVYGRSGDYLNFKLTGGKEWYPYGEKELFESIEDFIRDIKQKIEFITKLKGK